MEKFEVAYFKEQSVYLIVIFLDSSFDRKSKQEQSKVRDALQVCATSAGFTGTVVPVWEVDSGYRFIAPPKWHPFFQTPNIYPALVAKINKTLTCPL